MADHARCDAMLAEAISRWFELVKATCAADECSGTGVRAMHEAMGLDDRCVGNLVVQGTKNGVFSGELRHGFLTGFQIGVLYGRLDANEAVAAAGDEEVR